MTKLKSKAELIFDAPNNQYVCQGDWSILNINEIENTFHLQPRPNLDAVKVSGETLTAFDSAGALTLMKCMNTLTKQHHTIELVHFNPHQLSLIHLLETKKDILGYAPPPPKKEGFLYKVGVETYQKIDQIQGLLQLIGDIVDKLFLSKGAFRQFQMKSIIANIYTTGVTALPIIGLLSFLIGIVLAYEMGLQLKMYGANIFIAFLSGVAIFREFAPLMTAIIVAGRTSSAFAAQIGSMKINEEIDALLTMGLSPTQLLVIPKVIGLTLIFPLLIFWSSFFGILGAMIMAKFMLHVNFMEFLIRLQESVGLQQLLLGLYKAPTFSILIALVGCFQGFRVKFNADSLGTQTTKSVVQALFLIIIADAVYAVTYSWLDL